MVTAPCSYCGETHAGLCVLVKAMQLLQVYECPAPLSCARNGCPLKCEDAGKWKLTPSQNIPPGKRPDRN